MTDDRLSPRLPAPSAAEVTRHQHRTASRAVGASVTSGHSLRVGHHRTLAGLAHHEHRPGGRIRSSTIAARHHEPRAPCEEPAHEIAPTRPYTRVLAPDAAAPHRRIRGGAARLESHRPWTSPPARAPPRPPHVEHHVAHTDQSIGPERTSDSGTGARTAAAVCGPCSKAPQQDPAQDGELLARLVTTLRPSPSARSLR